jgi:hypothetical protein
MDVASSCLNSGRVDGEDWEQVLYHVFHENVDALQAFTGNIHVINRAFRNALHTAAALRKPMALRWCIERGVGRNGIDNTPMFSLTATMYACLSFDANGAFVPERDIDSIACVRMLIQSGANPLLVDDQQRTCLHWAIQRRLPKIVYYLVSITEGRELLDMVAKDGKRPRDEIPKQFPADQPLPVYEENTSPAGAYVGGGELDPAEPPEGLTTDMLLDRVRAVLESPIPEKDSTGVYLLPMTPARNLAAFGCRSTEPVTEKVEVRLNGKMVKISRSEAVGLSARCGKTENIREILEDLLSVDILGRNVLMNACLGRQAETLRFCLHNIKEMGEDKLTDAICQVDDFGRSVCNYAAGSSKTNPDESDAPECMEIVLAHGAEINSVDRSGRWPLYIASKNGYTKIVKVIMCARSVRINFSLGGNQAGDVARNEECRLLLREALNLETLFRFVHSGDLENLRLHANRQNVLFVSGSKQMNLLGFAAAFGKVEALKYLLQLCHPEDLAVVQRGCNMTVLHLVCARNPQSAADNREETRLRCLQEVLKVSTRLDMVNAHTKIERVTALRLAVESGYKLLVKELLKIEGISVTMGLYAHAWEDCSEEMMAVFAEPFTSAGVPMDLRRLSVYIKNMWALRARKEGAERREDNALNSDIAVRNTYDWFKSVATMEDAECARIEKEMLDLEWTTTGSAWIVWTTENVAGKALERKKVVLMCPGWELCDGTEVETDTHLSYSPWECGKDFTISKRILENGSEAVKPENLFQGDGTLSFKIKITCDLLLERPGVGRCLSRAALTLGRGLLDPKNKIYAQLTYYRKGSGSGPSAVVGAGAAAGAASGSSEDTPKVCVQLEALRRVHENVWQLGVILPLGVFECETKHIGGFMINEFFPLLVEKGARVDLNAHVRSERFWAIALPWYDKVACTVIGPGIAIERSKLIVMYMQMFHTLAVLQEVRVMHGKPSLGNWKLVPVKCDFPNWQNRLVLSGFSSRTRLDFKAENPMEPSDKANPLFFHDAAYISKKLWSILRTLEPFVDKTVAKFMELPRMTSAEITALVTKAGLCGEECWVTPRQAWDVMCTFYFMDKAWEGGEAGLNLKCAEFKRSAFFGAKAGADPMADHKLWFASEMDTQRTLCLVKDLVEHELLWGVHGLAKGRVARAPWSAFEEVGPEIELGRGEFATVVKGSAAEPGLVGEVAIKKYFELNPTMWRREGIHNLEVANARRVIFKEAAMMALVDSPNIPKVYAVTEGRADTLPRVVMELKSFNLQEVIHYDLLRRGRGETVLTLDFIRSMFIGLLKALKCLHGHTPPIVHYDIKEENVLLGTGCGRKEELSGDDVALADFGCARFKIECVDALKVPCAGNMKYKAPEVYAGVVNCSADIFSLCYMVCTVLCECDPGRGGGLLSISVEEISMKACGILQRTDPTFASVLLSGCSAEANLRGTASSILILMGITE